MSSVAGEAAAGQRELATWFLLNARRLNSGFAASAKLDAGLTLSLKFPTSEISVVFQMARGGVPIDTLRRRISRTGEFPPGDHTLWLSEDEGFYSLNGLEPIGAYSLSVAEVTIKTVRGTQTITNPTAAMTQLEPLAMGEELPVPLASAAWQFFNAAPALKPATGLQQNSGLQLTWPATEPGNWPLFGGWGYQDAAHPGLVHDAERVYRFRYRITSNLPTWGAVRGVRLRTGLDTGNEVNALRLYGKLTDGSLAVPPAASNYREFTLFSAHRQSPVSGERRLVPYFEVVSEEDEGTASPGAVELAELAVSSTEISGLQWMKSIEWNFSTSPYAGGWSKDVPAGSNDFIVPSYHTKWTEWNPVNKTHRHGLRIAVSGPRGHHGGWKFENLFQFRKLDGQGNLIATDGYDLRSRLLKVIATVRANVSGDKTPWIYFALEGNGFSNQYQVAGLFRPDGSPVAAGEETEVVFFIAPEHNQLLADLSGEAKKPLTFRYHVQNLLEGAAAESEIVLENLKVYETLIGDMPQGFGYATYNDDWPQISIPAEVGAFKTVQPSAPSCPVVDPPTQSVYMVNDHGWALSNGAWHVYGIFESGLAIKPMPAGPRADKTQYNTIGATSFFVSGLSHVHVCTPGQGLFYSDGSDEYLDYIRDQPPADPNAEIMVPQGPGEVWNLWAPKLVNYNGAFYMFYSSSWGADIWLAKNSDPNLGVASWQYLNGDGTVPAGNRFPVVPANASVAGRDFTVVQSKDINGDDVYHGYWNGGDPVRVYHVEAPSPLAFNYNSAQTVYTLINADSGRMPQDSESVFVVYDDNAKLYYLAISKDGNLAPGFGVGTTFILDYTNKAIIAADPIAGDRSVVIDNSNKTDPAQPDLVAPIDMVSADATNVFGNLSSILNGGVVIRARAMVLDRGDNVPGSAAMILCNMRNGHRELFSGRGRGRGPALQLPARLAQAQYIHPNTDEVTVIYYMTDRRNWAAQDGCLYMVDAGAQKKMRSNFVGVFGETTRVATGNRTPLIQNLGDPMGMVFDGTNIYVVCRNQGTIIRANAATLPTGPLAAQVLQSGLTNPTELTDAVERLYVVECIGSDACIRWVMKDGSGTGVVPVDPSVPFEYVTDILWLYDFCSLGPHLLLTDLGSGGRTIALRLSDGKRSIVSGAGVGVGPVGLPTSVVQGLIYDELDDLVVKVYWSANPNSFDQYHYIASMQHHAAEWLCDVTQPGNPWYFAFTNFKRVNMPDGEELMASYGWGVQPIKWSPPIAPPV